MIGRAPINQRDFSGEIVPGFSDQYMHDNHTYFDLPHNIFHDKPAYTYMRKFARARNGHGAILALKAQYLGANSVNSMATRAENRLQTLRYEREARCWNFDSYLRNHLEQHIILEGLEVHGYKGLDERSKVRHLMNGIKTTDLDSVKSQILAHPTLQSDFSKASGLYTDFIKARGNGLGNEPRNTGISGVGTAKDGEANMSTDDWLYTKEEYSKLSSAAKNGLRLKRLARGHVPGNKRKQDGKKNGDDKSKRVKFNLNKRQIKSLAREIAAVRASGDEGDDDDTNDGNDNDDGDTGTGPNKGSKRVTNRNNSALRRK